MICKFWRQLDLANSKGDGKMTNQKRTTSTQPKKPLSNQWITLTKEEMADMEEKLVGTKMETAKTVIPWIPLVMQQTKFKMVLRVLQLVTIGAMVVVMVVVMVMAAGKKLVSAAGKHYDE